MNTSDNAADIYRKNREAGVEHYKALSRAINSSVTSAYLEGWLEQFKGEHPTLQASLFRSLTQAMRETHVFVDGVDADGRHFTECTDGRIAGDLPAFIAHGYIPFI